nr:uncharacterized protein CI109_004922 [Kwoniella shandongensis]KAA5526719.1 hypothetical protein CI109_004922 [Kwoniella shandongensis]
MARYSQLLSALLGITILALLNVNAVALPVDDSSLSAREADALATTFSEWPAVGHSSPVNRKRGGETNADRIKRGLNPLAPKQRSPTPTHQLLPRLSPAPATALEYNFVKCIANFRSRNGDVVNGATVQDAANTCATNAAANNDDNFAVRFAGDTTYICNTGITDSDTVVCNEINFGW